MRIRTCRIMGIIACALLFPGVQAAWPATYVSTDLPKTGNPISSQIVVPDNLMVEKATITVEALEALECVPYMGSSPGMSLELRSPDNSAVTLLMPGYKMYGSVLVCPRYCYDGMPCSYTHHFDNVTFDDTCENSWIDSFEDPGSGHSVTTPYWELSLLSGEAARGIWTLNVSVHEHPSSYINLSGWHLTIEGCEENPDGCAEPVFNNIYQVGGDLCVCVPCPVSDTSTYEWAKDDVPLTDDARVSGANERTLHITGLDSSDAGTYSCLYDDGSKAPAEYRTEVRVVTEVPVSSSWAIVLLIGICGSLGIFFRGRLGRFNSVK